MSPVLRVTRAEALQTAFSSKSVISDFAKEDAEENSTAFEELVGIDYEEEYIDDDARFYAEYDAYLEFEWEGMTGR